MPDITSLPIQTPDSPPLSARLDRIATYAADTGQRILLENLNYEPEHAEVKYLAHTVDECAKIFDAIPPNKLGWAFTVNHANLVPEGVDGFLRIGIRRIRNASGEASD